MDTDGTIHRREFGGVGMEIGMVVHWLIERVIHTVWRSREYAGLVR
jgi:hypothetical protein